MGNTVSLEESLSNPFIAVALCFFASSWVLNRWPQLLHRKKGGPHGCPLEGPPPVCIAHRGGQAEAAENTLSAFAYSIEECKCDMVELDVWVSKDRRLVVAHDDDLSRVTGRNVRISQTDYAALPPVMSSKEMEQGAPCMDFYPEFSCFPRPFAAERIPLLEEVYERFPDVFINVDMKGPMDPAAVSQVVALTRKYKRQKRTVFGGFLQEKLNRIKTEMPEGVVAMGPQRTLFLVAAYYIGLLPFLSIWEDVFEFPVSLAYLQREAVMRMEARRQRMPGCLHFLPLNVLASLKAKAVYFLLSNPGLISALKRRGLLVLGWVVNCTDEYKEGFGRVGCHGLMTDRPKHLRQYLDTQHTLS